jgi:hypothetical protein
MGCILSAPRLSDSGTASPLLGGDSLTLANRTCDNCLAVGVGPSFRRIPTAFAPTCGINFYSTIDARIVRFYARRQVIVHALIP